MTEMAERRRVARVAVPWHLNGWVSETREVRLLDLSTSGVRIEHVEPLRPGSSCTLELPPPLGSLHLTARIVWSLVRGGEQTPDGERRLHYQSGLAFTGISPDQQTVLAGALGNINATEHLKNRKPTP